MNGYIFLVDIEDILKVLCIDFKTKTLYLKSLNEASGDEIWFCWTRSTREMLIQVIELKLNTNITTECLEQAFPVEAEKDSKTNEITI